MSWLGMEKNKPSKTKAFKNQKKCTKTQSKHKKLKPGLVVFFNVRSGNGAGLFSKIESKIESRVHYAPQLARGIESSSSGVVGLRLDDSANDAGPKR